MKSLESQRIYETAIKMLEENTLEFEAEYQPKVVKFKDDTSLLMDRRISKIFPITELRKRISYIFIPESNSQGGSLGTLLYAGDAKELGHEGLYRFALELQLIKPEAEPSGGGILAIENNSLVFKRDSDLYGDLSLDLRQKIIQSLSQEYSEYL